MDEYTTYQLERDARALRAELAQHFDDEDDNEAWKQQLLLEEIEEELAFRALGP